MGVDIKTILYPVDFTSSTKRVLPYAKLLRDKFGATIHLLHVVRGPEEFAGFELGGTWFSTYEDQLIKGAKRAMERFVDKYFVKNPPETHVAMGDVVDEICRYAKKLEADIIVIGTHGRKGLEKIVFGSVAEGVVRNAPCPVLTVNPYKKEGK